MPEATPIMFEGWAGTAQCMQKRQTSSRRASRSGRPCANRIRRWALAAARSNADPTSCPGSLMRPTPASSPGS